jgi:hypothetical protein
MTKRIKYPLKAYRLNIEWWNPDEEHFERGFETIDILEDEVTPDLMTDLFSYFNWLYYDKDTNEDWDIFTVDEIIIGDKMQLRQLRFGRFRDFYKNNGTGEHLHV